MRGQEELRTSSRVFDLSTWKEGWSLVEVEEIIGRAGRAHYEWNRGVETSISVGGILIFRCHLTSSEYSGPGSGHRNKLKIYGGRLKL